MKSLRDEFLKDDFMSEEQLRAIGILNLLKHNYLSYTLHQLIEVCDDM